MRHLYLTLLFTLFFGTCVRAQIAVAPGGSLTVLPQNATGDRLTVRGNLDVYTLGTLNLEGQVMVDGDVNLSGTLRLRVAGETPGTEVGRLTATGSIFPAGTLVVYLAGGYDPVGRIDYPFASSPDVFGIFSTETLPDADWSIVYRTTEITLRLDKAPPAFELASFTGSPRGRYADLSWGTSVERATDYFAIEQLRNSIWQEVGQVPAAGNDTDGADYTFTHRDTGPGSPLTYRLKLVASDGTFTYSDSLSFARPVPDSDDVLLVGNFATLHVREGSFIEVRGKDVVFDVLSEVTNLGHIRTNLNADLDGIYRTEIRGTLPIIDIPQIIAGNDAIIDGELEVSLQADYSPSGNVSFPLIVSNNRTGTFINVTYPPGDWTMNYTATEVRLEPVDVAAPVEWLSFTGRPEAEGVLLHWVTAREENSDYFGVERQDELGGWLEIGRVTAAGFATEETAYTFSDPAPGPTDPVLYRLRQVDFDGTLDYSVIVAVRLPTGGALALYPNPTTQSIYLRGQLPGRDYRIVDAAGRVVVSGRLPEEARPRIDLPLSMPTGLYFLQFTDGDGLARRFELVR